MSTYTEEMLSLFEDMRSEEWFRAEVIYKGFSMIGVKMALSVGYEMQISGNDRTAKTSVDVLRSDAVTAGLYALAAYKQQNVARPPVSVVTGSKTEEFLVMDCRDDNESDPTVKLILSARQ